MKIKSVRFNDAEQIFDLNVKLNQRKHDPRLDIWLVNPEQVIRAGEKTKFVVTSDYKLDANTSLLAVMHSQSKIYENKSVLVYSNFYERVEDGIIVAELEMVIPPVTTTTNDLYLTVLGSCNEPVASLFSSEEDKKNRLVFFGRMKIGAIDKYGPVKLEKTGIWENPENLSTQVAFEISGNLERVVNILGTLETYKFEYTRVSSRYPLSLITILSMGNKLYDTNKFFAPEIDKIPNGFVDFPLSCIHNGTITVTKVFDRISQAGNYSLKAMVIKSSGEVSHTNEIRFSIQPIPIRLSFGLLPYSIILGETIDVEAVVTNNIGVPYEGTFSLQFLTINDNGTIESISTEQTKVVQVKDNGMENILFEVTPRKIGEIRLAIKSLELNKTMVTTEDSVLVLPFGRMFKSVSKSVQIAVQSNEAITSKHYQDHLMDANSTQEK